MEDPELEENGKETRWPSLSQALLRTHKRVDGHYPWLPMILYFTHRLPFSRRVSLELWSRLRLSGQERKHFAVNYPSRLLFCDREKIPPQQSSPKWWKAQSTLTWGFCYLAPTASLAQQTAEKMKILSSPTLTDVYSRCGFCTLILYVCWIEPERKFSFQKVSEFSLVFRELPNQIPTMKCSRKLHEAFNVRANQGKARVTKQMLTVYRFPSRCHALKLAAEWREMRFVCIHLRISELSCEWDGTIPLANNLQSNKIQYFMRWCLECALAGNHFLDIIPSGCRRNEKWILQKCSWSALPIHFEQLSLLNSIFIRAPDRRIEWGNEKGKQIKEIVV